MRRKQMSEHGLAVFALRGRFTVVFDGGQLGFELDNLFLVSVGLCQPAHAKNEAHECEKVHDFLESFIEGSR
jgi:hypothetical protein